MDPTVPIAALPEQLGFTETDELKTLRGQWVQAMVQSDDDSERVAELATRYRDLAEPLVCRRNGIDYARAQIGLDLLMGLIRLEAGRLVAYLEALSDARDYASGLGMDEVAARLETARNATESVVRFLSELDERLMHAVRAPRGQRERWQQRWLDLWREAAADPERFYPRIAQLDSDFETDRYGDS